MQKDIIIDGKTVPMKATGATPVFYRKLFSRDIFHDMMAMNEGIGHDSEGKPFVKDFEKIDFGTVERLAYTMAYQADHSLPEFIDWLDQFETSAAVMLAMDQFLPLYMGGLETASVSKNS